MPLFIHIRQNLQPLTKVVRQAIQEVDSLTEKCDQEVETWDHDKSGHRQENMTRDYDIRQEAVTWRMSDNFPDTRSPDNAQTERVSLPDVHARAYNADQDSEEEELTSASSGGGGKLGVKKFFPGGEGHRSRQGSKRRRKKDVSKVSSPPKLKLKLPSSRDATSVVSPRSASYTSLRRGNILQ